MYFEVPALSQCYVNIITNSLSQNNSETNFIDNVSLQKLEVNENGYGISETRPIQPDNQNNRR
jgi:hypothetical protein